MVVGELKRGHVSRLVLVERTRTAMIERTVFQSWNLAVGFRFSARFLKSFERYGANRLNPFCLKYV
jgi:hypothetical protein